MKEDMPTPIEHRPQDSRRSCSPPSNYSSRSPSTTSRFQPPVIGTGYLGVQMEPSPEIQPYDAWVLAGGRLFRAHAQILCAHSPYLRATINALGEARLLLPHIPSGGFSAILTYMYTGRLSLAHAPVYEILITGHLLQMPSVVALCQALLNTSALPPSIPTATTLLPFVNEEPTQGALPPALSAWRNLARLVPASGVATPSVQTPTLIRPTPTRPVVTGAHNDSAQAVIDVVTEPERPPFLQGKERFIFCPIIKKGMSNPSSTSRETEEKTSFSSVVLDIAACDGPVFFERVINKAFRHNQSDVDGETDSDNSDINVVDTATTQPPHSPSTLLGEYLKTAAASQVQSQLTPVPTSGSNTRTYHCIYCNSTFKSHYCYQKHMRRHINPITVEENRGADTRDSFTTDQDVSSSEPESTQSKLSTTTKRPHESSSKAETAITVPNTDPPTIRVPSSAENTPNKLRVLDLNVQYFPCKTCGSKFPSYYFVHKHRRLCHREEEDQMQERKDNQTPSSCDSSSYASLNSRKSDLETNGRINKPEANVISNNPEVSNRKRDTKVNNSKQNDNEMHKVHTDIKQSK